MLRPPPSRPKLRRYERKEILWEMTFSKCAAVPCVGMKWCIHEGGPSGLRRTLAELAKLSPLHRVNDDTVDVYKGVEGGFTEMHVCDAIGSSHE